MELNYKTFGQGLPVVILHGLFGMLDNWQAVARKLSEDYTAYLPDLRNHGRSPHHDDMDYPCMAEDLRYFMESHWMFKAHIMGHSMGGKTAMQFALAHPGMVDKLIVVDIAPKAYSGGHQDIFDALMSANLTGAAERSDVLTQLQSRIEAPGVQQFLMKNLSRNKKGKFEWKMNLPVLYKNYQNLLATIDADEPFEGPALFIRGERSDYILDEDWPMIKAVFPRAQLETIAGAGHWVHADKPEELLEVLRAFLAG
ncbi:MAG: alpha/beta fold hydrolase [Phaeodactylibacter sp.]|nr:alpha/beta fold hydrolase [Phaeodactylibacter sp.]MCB9275092.1 alpha/beta fold hydrolase [Lewinellaceae bacterium]